MSIRLVTRSLVGGAVILGSLTGIASSSLGRPQGGQPHDVAAVGRWP